MEASERGMDRVVEVQLRLGEFSGVESELLQRAFALTKVGTKLEQAELRIQRVPLVLYCRPCDNEYVASLDDLRCPGCLAHDYDVITGRELDLVSFRGEA